MGLRPLPQIRPTRTTAADQGGKEAIIRRFNTRKSPMQAHHTLRFKTLAITLLVSLIAIPVWPQQESPAAESTDQETHEYAKKGVQLLMEGELNGATTIFTQIQHKYPTSALGYLLEADVVWWRIYYATGNLVDPDVFDVVSKNVTPYDSHFSDLVDAAIRKSEHAIAAKQDVARNLLYEGMAYALRARLEGLRGRDLPTARAGKKMRSFLLAALQADPNLTDAYLGVGIYNYFVDTLPTIVKFLSIFIGLPSGSRDEGLKQMEKAATEGEMTKGEALFYLAKDYSRESERQYAKSLELFQKLADEYPHNPMWRLMVASLRLRLNQRAEGEAMYRQILAETSGKSAENLQAIHHAVAGALMKLHPNEELN
jgi:tetratricopeptide (TPR) repeat protein